VPLRPLAPGQYNVRWRVLSVDTHKTEGSFGFEVRP
jgi:methionine-rich copper-binding protein CopC